MKHLMSGVVQLLGALFGVLVLSFTGYQTWMLLFEVSQNAIVATIGLILFEGGTIYWWSIFKSEAKGIMQMALSLLLFVFGLLLMVGSNGLHLGAIDPTFLGEKTPERLILVAAVISLVGKLLFPLLSPEMTQNIWQRALQGMLLLKALMKTEATLEGEAQRIANTLGADMARLVEMDLYTQYRIPHNLHRPALSASVPEVVEGEVVGREEKGVRSEGKGVRSERRPRGRERGFIGDWSNFWNALAGSWKGKKRATAARRPEPAEPEASPTLPDPPADMSRYFVVVVGGKNGSGRGRMTFKANTQEQVKKILNAHPGATRREIYERAFDQNFGQWRYRQIGELGPKGVPAPVQPRFMLVVTDADGHEITRETSNLMSSLRGSIQRYKAHRLTMYEWTGSRYEVFGTNDDRVDSSNDVPGNGVEKEDSPLAR